MRDIKISVIMPVYRVEEYVGKAIESILGQTFMDFEFLIVDDGTPDRSGEICDEYAKRDSRIQVPGQKKRCFRICMIWLKSIRHSLWSVVSTLTRITETGI